MCMWQAVQLGILLSHNFIHDHSSEYECTYSLSSCSNLNSARAQDTNHVNFKLYYSHTHTLLQLWCTFICAPGRPNQHICMHIGFTVSDKLHCKRWPFSLKLNRLHLTKQPSLSSMCSLYIHYTGTLCSNMNNNYYKENLYYIILVLQTFMYRAFFKLFLSHRHI